jgi:hypothetical protein
MAQKDGEVGRVETALKWNPEVMNTSLGLVTSGTVDFKPSLCRTLHLCKWGW